MLDRRVFLGLSARGLVAIGGARAAVVASAARPSPLNGAIRIGFATDLSGPYQAVDGAGGVAAIRMAIHDADDRVAGRPVELVTADHRNDVTLASAIAQRWCGEDRVDMVISGVNSDTSLAITAVTAFHGVPTFVVGAGTSVQTRERAAPAIIQYAYDTVALATVPGLTLTHRGLKRWFFVTADYPFGRELQAHGAAAIGAAGGTVVGSVRNPHDTADFRPYLAQARDSGADVLGLANGHAELVKAMAAMKAMGLGGRMALVGLLTFVNDISDMGLEEAQGLYVTDSWYWSRDDATRAWATRFHTAQGVMPSSLQAADYSAATQFLRAVDAIGGTEPRAVLEHLRSTTFDDMYVHQGRVREDGTMLHDMHLLRVKAPAAASMAWDFYEHVATVPGGIAFPTTAATNGQSRQASHRG